MTKNSIDEILNMSAPTSSLRLSYSRVSAFDQDGPMTLKHKRILKGEHLDFGSIVDDIISEEDLTKRYVVFDGKIPTAMSLTLAEYMIESGIEHPNTDELLEIIKSLKLWGTIKKEETLIKKYTSELQEYVMAKVKCNKLNMKLVSKELMFEAEELAGIILTHPHTKDELNEAEYDLVFQHELNFEYNGFRFLSFVDIIKIDHENKTIQPFDLKTGSGTSGEWTKSFIKYRYYFQYILYTIGLVNIAEQLDLKGYTVLPFKFMFAGRTEKLPIIFEVHPLWDEAAINGFTTVAGYKYRGLDDLLNQIDWHWDNQIFNISKEAHESNGVLTISSDVISTVDASLMSNKK